MKKMLFIVLTAVVLLLGCDNAGEEPLPSPGPNYNAKGGIESITLFVNGSFYNFDYTAQYDGLQLIEYTPPKPRDSNGNRVGGAFSSLSSSAGGGFAGSEKSIYSVEGGNALEYNHHLPNNDVETWRITLFDNPPIKISDYKSITFWAKYAAKPEAYASSSGGIITPQPVPNIVINAVTKSGHSIVMSGKNSFTQDDVNRADMGETAIWRNFKVPLDLNQRVGAGESVTVIPLSPEETLHYWEIQVPKDAGRIYVDEVILRKD